jgi:hypothetical protein
MSDMAWHYLVELSVQYYASGRFAALSRLHRAAANLLHHAVELLLKAVLVRSLPLERLKKEFGHDLPLLWQAATAASPSLVTPQRQRTIAALHKFEDLRYPDLLLSHGGTLTVALQTGEDPRVSGTRPSSGAHYQFNLEDIDELWAALFHGASANPAAFLQHLTPEARAVLEDRNRHSIVRSER